MAALFKKSSNDDNYDPMDMRVTDLRKGYIFDYDLKTWMVTGEYEYDWGDEYFTREYKIESGDDVCFLHVEEDDQVELTITKRVKMRSIDENLPEYILENEDPPNKLEYKGITYLKDERNPGYYRDVDAGEDDWSEFITWDYYDDDDKHVLSIEQWGEQEFEASAGKVVQEFEISNIIPGEDNTKKKASLRGSSDKSNTKSKPKIMKYLWVIIVGIILLIIFARGCGGGSGFTKNPVDDIIKEMKDVPTFTILLHDMNVEGSISKTYKHQYRVLAQSDSVPEETITPWYEVKRDFFEKHINHMGMEIASKKDGKVSKNVAPPGYSNYVGNSRYGRWRNRSDGSSFWEFYGKYAMMSSMFNMMAMPVRRSYYDDYRSNYYGTSRTYYGPRTGSGSYMYGTGSAYTRTNNPRSTWSSKASNRSFRQRVRSGVSRSSSKTSRSSSRYRSSSRSRSSGGFGK